MSGGFSFVFLFFLKNLTNISELNEADLLAIMKPLKIFLTPF